MPFIGKVNGPNALTAILIVLLAALALPLPLWMSFGETAQASPAVAKSSAAGRAEPTPTPTPVVSRGRAAHGAKAWHDAGYKGGGSNPIKVGIIDSGFNGFRILMGSELPSSDRVNIHCYKPDGTPAIRVGNLGRHLNDLTHCNGYYNPGMPPTLTLKDHGTIVSQTLTDVSPEVDLYIANPQSWQQLSTTVDWMTSHGVAVINHSIGWGLVASGDGNAPMGIPNHPLDIVDKAVAKGILWVNAAGNSGESTWYGAYKDPDGDRILSFYDVDGNNPETNGMEVSAGKNYSVYLRWDAPWTGMSPRCRLKVETIGGGKIVTSTTYERWGNPYPYQESGFKPATKQTYYFSIISEETTAGGAVIDSCPPPHRPRWIQLQISSRALGSLDYIRDSGRTYSGSNYYQIGVPSESDNLGMLAVGAAHLNNLPVPAPTIADYSNRGPTIDGRKKPEVVGVSNELAVITGTQSGDVASAIRGTSYAAPHVAGLAALVLHRYKDAWGTKYTPADLANYLKENAVQKDTALADPNNVWGYGFAMLPNPAPAASFSTAPSTITAGSSQSFTIASSSNVPSVKVVINNSGDTGKLAFGSSGAACPSSSGSISSSRSKGVAFNIKGCTAGEATIRLYKANTNILLRIYTVTVTLPPPTGLSLSTVSGNNRSLRVAYTRSQSPHRYQFKLEQRNLLARTETWTVVDTNTDSSPPETFTDVARGYHYRARGRNCQDTAQEDTCGAWSGYTNIIELSDPGIAISGLTGSYIAGDTDAFSVTLSDLTLDQPYTVTLASSQGSVIGFNFRCNQLPTSGFNAPANSHTVRFTLHACQIPGTTVTAQSGTITAKLWKGSASTSGGELDTATANATVTKATGALSPLPTTAFKVGHDQTFTLNTNVPNVWISATLSGDAGRLTLPTTQGCHQDRSGRRAVNGNSITIRGCVAGAARLTIYRSNSIIKLAEYAVTVNASTTKLSPDPEAAAFTVGHDRTFTVTTDIAADPGLWISATYSGDSGRLTMPSSTQGCHQVSSGLRAANGNTITLRGCVAGTATVKVYRRNSSVHFATYTVTVNASTTKLSPDPSAAAFTVGHDRTFTVTTDIAADPGLWIGATYPGDSGRLTMPSSTQGCHQTSSGLLAANGNTITLRGCIAGTATLKVYRRNSSVHFATYTVTVNASTTKLSPTPATFTAGHDQTFTVTTDIADNPGLWIGATYSGDSGRLTMPSSTQGCHQASSGLLAANGNTITLRGCIAGTATLKVYRRNSSVHFATYTVTVNASTTKLSPTPATFTVGTNQTFAVTTDIANNPGLWIGFNYPGDTGRLLPAHQSCPQNPSGIAAVTAIQGGSIALKPCRAGTVTIKVNRSYSSVTLITYTVTVNSS